MYNEDLMELNGSYVYAVKGLVQAQAWEPRGCPRSLTRPLKGEGGLHWMKAAIACEQTNICLVCEKGSSKLKARRTSASMKGFGSW